MLFYEEVSLVAKSELGGAFFCQKAFFFS